jgi:hypothetical protein
MSEYETKISIANTNTHTHTHAIGNRHIRNTLHTNTQYSTLIYIQNYNIFKSHTNKDSVLYIKILGFMGDILAVREKIFKSINSLNNRIPL